MRVKAERNIKLSGNANPVGKAKMNQAINKAFVCQFFGVKPNTPRPILKEAIKRLTGENMSFSNFKRKVLIGELSKTQH